MSTSHHIAALFEKHADRLRRVIGLKFRNLDDYLAEDACMFAWAQLLAEPERADHEYALAWLTTVATNEAIRLYNERKDEASAELAPDPAVVLDLPTGIDLDAALAQLKPAQRVVLRLYSQGYSYLQIAALTGQTKTWVNRHLAEGKAALREILTE